MPRHPQGDGQMPRRPQGDGQCNDEDGLAMRQLKALILAPLTAPVLYWLGSVVSAAADPGRQVSLRALADGLSIILLIGGPVAYAAAIVAAAPAFYLLRRAGRRAVPLVLGLGTVIGIVTAILLRPYLRGELLSIILTSWQGAALGCASAAVFCWLNLRSGDGADSRHVVQRNRHADHARQPNTVIVRLSVLEVIMSNKSNKSNMAVTAALTIILGVSGLPAQEKKASGTKSVMHDLTVTTSETVYKGTMDLAIDSGKVTGKMVVTSPSEVTGTVAGTSKAGVMTLEFPYHMTERNCDGTLKMTITLPEKLGLATGTMEAGGCGQEPGEKVTGTVELKPSSLRQ
jgi:hypothetical protein